jgi:putative ABC transport system permease protein
MLNEETIKYSLKNLKQSKSRSILTILSIFVGIATIFIFISFGVGLFNYVEQFTTDSTADKLMITPRGSGAPGLDTTFAITEDDVRAISKTSGVYEVTGLYAKAAEVVQGNTRKYIFAISYDPKKPLILETNDFEVIAGRDLMGKDSGKVILGYNYQFDDKVLPKAVGVNDKINVQGVDLRVVGFFEEVGNPADDSQIYMSNEYFEDLFNNSDEGYGWVIARADVENLDQVIENIKRNLRKTRNVEEGKEDFFIQSWQELLGTYAGVLNGIIGFILLIALISVVVSAINTANTMITSVLERTKEIGIIKSIGGKNRDIFGIFLFESGFLGFVAGVFGVLIGGAISYVVGSALDAAGWGFLSPYYSWSLFLGLIAFATLTGALSGVIPAWNASKTNPVDALRYE